MTKTLRLAAAALVDAANAADPANATRWIEANAPDQRTLDAAMDLLLGAAGPIFGAYLVKPGRRS